jgi:hypothetical protein
MTRLEQLGAAALAVVIFIALVMRDCSRRAGDWIARSHVA